MSVIFCDYWRVAHNLLGCVVYTLLGLGDSRLDRQFKAKRNKWRVCWNLAG